MVSHVNGNRQACAKMAGSLILVLLAAILLPSQVAYSAVGDSALGDVSAIRTIVGLKLAQNGDTRSFEIESDGPVIWTSFRDGQGRLVVELPNSQPSSEVQALNLSDNLVRSASVSVVAAGQRPMSRLVIDTAVDVEHAVVPRGDRLIVELSEVDPMQGTARRASYRNELKVARATMFQSGGSPDDPSFGPAPSGVPATTLQSVDVTTGDGSTTVWVSGDGAFYYSYFPLLDPYRFVIDLIGVVNTSPVSTIAVQGQLVDGVRVAQYKPQPELVSRVVIDLVDPAAPSIEATPDGLKLTFVETEMVADDALSAGAPMADEAEGYEAAVVEQAIEEAMTDEPAYSVEEAYVAPEVADTAEMRAGEMDVDSASAMQEEDEAPEYNTWEEQTDTAETWEETDTADEWEPVEPADSWDEAAPAAEPAMEPVAQPSGSLFNVSVDLSGESSTEPESPFGARDVSPTGGSVYTGEPMTLSLQDADIKDVLRSFAQISGLNVVVQPGVSGAVTVEFTDVPWDQALDQILKINGLDYELEGSIMRVAPASVLRAEAEEQARLEAAKSLSIPLKTILRRVSYAGAGEIAGILGGGGGSAIMSARGSVIVDPRTNTLIIKELPSHIDTVIAVIENLDIPEPQVMIEARIIETTKRFSRTLGLQLGFGALSSAERGNTTGLQFPNNGTADGGVNLLTGGSNGFLDVTLGNVLNTFNLSAFLQAAESEGLINILSAPRITTLNNEQASIQSGLQIPIQTIANNTVSVQFVNATLRLDVTPHVTAEGTVLMDIDIQKREPQLAFAVVGASNAPISTKDASTRVIVRDGGTTVIGGIYKVTSDQGEDRVPGLSNVPVLKHLFKNKRRNDENEELLIFITPRVVKL